MVKINSVYTFVMVFLIIVVFLSLMQSSTFNKEIEYNKTMEVKEQVAVHNPGRSGLLISGSGDTASETKYLVNNKTITVKENVSLLKYWFSNLK